MLRRKAYDALMSWKNRNHKPLLVKGQRQVGKTFIIEKFGRDNYSNVILVNFVENDRIRSVFDDNLDVDSIITAMSMYIPDAKFVPKETLIIFDEIQECPRARTSLKFFDIDGRFDVIATGSLLGVNTHGINSIDAPVPVGYEEHMIMYSLDFEEFVWAKGVDEKVISHLRQRITNKEPIERAYMERFDSLFREFMIVGGMPQAVQTFIDENSFSSAGRIINSITEAAKADMNRYNDPLKAGKIVSCFNSIPSQLSQSNKKFMYSRIDGKGSRKSAEMYSDSLDWIVNAGYCNACRKLESLDRPLMSKEVHDQFKAYMSDTGMLIHMYGEDTIRAIYSDDMSYNLGAIVENVAAECITKCGYVPRYYSKNKGEGRMELDFVIDLGSELSVLEIKSGKYREYPSLSKVSDHFNIDRRIVFGRSNIEITDDGIEHYPLFTIAFLNSLEKKLGGPDF